jgi:hypothetical protein
MQPPAQGSSNAAPLSSSAGSTSTDRRDSVTTLTADTMPIERSGGYDDHTSVP